MKTVIRLALIGAGLILAGTQPALATPVFSGKFVGAFSDPVGPSAYVTILNNDIGSTAKFKWGTAITSLGRSSFIFDGVGSDSGEPNYSISLNTPFSLGLFTYNNTRIHNGLNITGVSFNLTSILNGVNSTTFTYGLSIINTPNGGSLQTPDFVEISSLSPASFNNFTYTDGNNYTFELLGFTRDHGATFESSTYANESSSTTAEIYGRYVRQSAPVPVPSAVWLLLSGLSGLGLFRRRK